MTKLLIIFSIFLFSILNLSAQDTTFLNGNGRTYSQIYDSLSSGLVHARIPNGVLYDRVAGWASMDEWVDGDTIYMNRAFQAWYDLEQSRLQTNNRMYQAMRDTIQSRNFLNRLPLLCFRYNFSEIDTNAYEDGRLSLVDGIITDNNLPQHPYLSKEVTFAAMSMDSIYQNENYTVEFDNNWLLNNTPEDVISVKLTNLTTGANFTLQPDESAILNFADFGIVWFKLEVLLDDNTIWTSKQRITVRKKDGGNCQRDFLLQSDIPFLGYDETGYPTTSNANYRIYYHYLPNTTECEETLKKPVIILDGFDPKDENKIGNIYDNYLTYEFNGKQYLGEELRQKGFDIIILNFPILGDQVPSRVKSFSGGVFAGYEEKKGRDGGTDYIERNAFLLVKLIQEVNEKLADNNSQEELVIIGPSMGGLISRYALAYMEKEYSGQNPNANMNHNCRLWISFDSPHEGANIPIATQQLVNFFGNTCGLQLARDVYNERIRSIAARQLLINQLPNNSFRSEFISSLNSNGLPGSMGYPTNLRKITLANGSGTGLNNAVTRANYIGLTGYKTIFNKRVVEMIGNYLPNYGQTGQTFEGLFTISRNRFLHYNVTVIKQTINTANYNTNGNMDIVPGGWFNSTEFLRTKVDPFLEDKTTWHMWWAYEPTHVFIPTISALGFINSSFNWSNPVDDRDLVCDNEIYFDNYYLPTQNEKHVSLTKASSDWVKDEIENDRNGCARLCATEITGTDGWICYSNVSTTTFTLNDNLTSPISTVWSISGGLTEISHTNTSITVVANSYNPNALISAHIYNNCGDDRIINKNVKTGMSFTPEVVFIPLGSCDYQATVTSDGIHPDFTYEWSSDGSTYLSGDEYYGTYTPQLGANIPVWVKVNTPCGTNSSQGYFTITQKRSGMCKKDSETTSIEGEISENQLNVYPNPSTGVWNITFPESNTSLTLYDLAGKNIMQKTKINVFGDIVRVDGNELKPGVYILKILSQKGIKKIKLVKN